MSVPVSTLISAAITTADVPTVAPAVVPPVVTAGGTIVPPTVAAAGLGRTVRTTSMPLLGPPVMTGSPVAFCHVVVPSTIVAKSA